MPHKYLSFLLPLLFAVSAPAWAADKTGFAGKWELDKKKTVVKGGPEELRQEIVLKGTDLVIKSKYIEPKTNIYPLMWVGVMTYELPLTTDGAEKVNQIGPFLHTSKTVVEGNKMTTDFTATIEGGTLTGRWLRLVSDDGKEMSMQVATKSTDGRTMDQTLHFRRK